MTDSNKRHPPDARQRSFVASDFSGREIPGFMLMYAAIAAVCILVGMTIESLTSFWQGFVFGIAVTMAAVVGLSLFLTERGRH
jgi:hypothetical protein